MIMYCSFNIPLLFTCPALTIPFPVNMMLNKLYVITFPKILFFYSFVSFSIVLVMPVNEISESSTA